MKIEKGSYGYVDNHKKRQLIKTLIFFAIPLSIILVGFVTTKTKMNYFTVIGVVGCLPACKEMVNVLMFWKRKSLKQEFYEQVQPHMQGMEALYELNFTSYDKNMPIDCMAVCGSCAVGYSSKKDLDTAFAEKHVKDILKGNGYRQNVKIFKELKPFLERLDALSAKAEEAPAFTPDARYPSMTREQVIRQLLLSISL